LLPDALSVGEVEQVQWLCEGRVETFPSVLHACWAAPDGRTALALANWTQDERSTMLERPPAGRTVRWHLLERDAPDSELLEETTGTEFVLPPLSVALVEYGLDWG
jgi:hypothetical protein